MNVQNELQYCKSKVSFFRWILPVLLALAFPCSCINTLWREKCNENIFSNIRIGNENLIRNFYFWSLACWRKSYFSCFSHTFFNFYFISIACEKDLSGSDNDSALSSAPPSLSPQPGTQSNSPDVWQTVSHLFFRFSLVFLLPFFVCIRLKLQDLWMLWFQIWEMKWNENRGSRDGMS